LSNFFASKALALAALLLKLISLADLFFLFLTRWCLLSNLYSNIEVCHFLEYSLSSTTLAIFISHFLATLSSYIISFYELNSESSSSKDKKLY